MAASTLLVVALFQPLRRRIQSRVDRRFNRGRYDAEHIVAAFVGRLREDVDLESLGAHISATVVRTVQPASVSVWLVGEARDSHESCGEARGWAAGKSAVRVAR